MVGGRKAFRAGKVRVLHRAGRRKTCRLAALHSVLLMRAISVVRWNGNGHAVAERVVCLFLPELESYPPRLSFAPPSSGPLG